ncbi:MAG: hypothetical protein IT361_07175 [Gemmatimonadaceae bacterium]|nr:hypothetical protein [Gemmatimonadaceae bacterium]
MPTLRNSVTGTHEIAIIGKSKKHHGISGESRADGAGVVGISVDGEGVSGFSRSGPGVVGQSDESTGVRGLSKAAHAVEGLSGTGGGVLGTSDSGIGVAGRSHTSFGVAGESDAQSGVRGTSRSGRGVEGWSESAYGVSGDSTSSAGVRGTSVEGRGVEGWSSRSEGVFGTCERGVGVRGVAGRSRFVGTVGVEVNTAVIHAGALARQVAMARADAGDESKLVDEATHAPTGALGTTREVGPVAALAAPAAAQPLLAHAVSPPAGAAVVIDRPPIDLIVDNNAGIGVAGEHLGGGIGVRATSRDGMGVAAYSVGHEAVHAETRSPGTAAVAAYNLNPHGTGAALYARKEGSRGHAGFFDGKVWIGGELAVGGDILLANADGAEDFDVVDTAAATPGTVMVIGDRGVLRPSGEAYDKAVVGIVSGAGSFRPALILDRQGPADDRAPIALFGKACCKVTADNGPIAVGDLLTTSPTPGHAMRASDPMRAFGSVIGKALAPLSHGNGLIPILIALQ